MLPLPVKLVRSLVLGETMSNPFHPQSQSTPTNPSFEHHPDCNDPTNLINPNKIPMLLFLPTNELITNTFRLASIARDIGMDFIPSSSLSHLIFSWPNPSSISTPSTSSSTCSSASSSSSTSTSVSIPNDVAPLPFPSLSTPTVSLSLLRYFVSLSRGLFKLVFFNLDPGSEFDRNWVCDYTNVALFSRVSGRRVGSMDDLVRDLAGHGWTFFRTPNSLSKADSVYLFRKKELNRVRVKGGGDIGEGRMRELRLPALDFRNEVPSKILLYILLMTDEIFQLVQL